MGKITDALEKAEMEKDRVRGDGSQIREQRTGPEAARPTSHNITPDDSFFKNGPNLTWDERLFQAVNSDPFLPEIFKILRSWILHPKNGGTVPKSLLLASVLPGEGKSFIAANTGICLVQEMDQYALLVDCDLRKPTLARILGLENRFGLADYLRDGTGLSSLFRTSSIAKLSVMTSGRQPLNPAELLGSARMADLVKEITERYDDRIIIFDSPPILIAAEAVVLTRLVDAVILVVREGGAGKKELQDAIDLIGAERILGIVFNGQTTNIIEKYLKPQVGYYYQQYSHKK